MQHRSGWIARSSSDTSLSSQPKSWGLRYQRLRLLGLQIDKAHIKVDQLLLGFLTSFLALHLSTWIWGICFWKVLVYWENQLLRILRSWTKCVGQGFHSNHWVELWVQRWISRGDLWLHKWEPRWWKQQERGEWLRFSLPLWGPGFQGPICA